MFSRAPVSQALRTSLRRATTKPPARATAPFTQTVALARSSQSTRPTIRPFSSSAATLTRVTPRPEGSSPDSSKKLHAGAEHVVEPASITDAQYHELADTYIDRLVEKLERIQEDREEVEVEYSAGVLTLTLPPAGTYILNKQPPNKQIWLSSPISGPKRYDWVVQGDQQHEKEGTEGVGRAGQWIYLRDGSSLSGLVRKEVGVDVDDDES